MPPGSSSSLPDTSDPYIKEVLTEALAAAAGAYCRKKNRRTNRDKEGWKRKRRMLCLQQQPCGRWMIGEDDKQSTLN